MFNETLLIAIFSNIEKIYIFHLDFFHSIKREFDQSMLQKEAVDEIGAVFLQNVRIIEHYSCEVDLKCNNVQRKITNY